MLHVLELDPPRRPDEHGERVGGVDDVRDLGFERDGHRLHVAGNWITLEGGGAQEGERPLLNHLAVLVDSAEAVERAAHERGAEVVDVVDAPNTLAVFLWAPDRVKLEYVEHKPSFSLA